MLNAHVFFKWSVFLLALVPVFAYSATATVHFSTGNAAVMNAQGIAKNLLKGDVIEVGDTIQTNNGRTQLKFTDGGYVSLQPDTVFKVDNYAYDAVPETNQRNFFSLIKGGMRAITGAVGKKTKQNYLINTPVATIGIRGTALAASLTTPQSQTNQSNDGDPNAMLTASCGDGALVLTTGSGSSTHSLVVQAGQTGIVNGLGRRAQRIERQATVSAAGINRGTPDVVQNDIQNQSNQNNVFSVSEFVNPETGVFVGFPLSVAKSYTGPFLGAGFFGSGEGMPSAFTYFDEGTLNFDASGNFIGYTSFSNESGFDVQSPSVLGNSETAVYTGGSTLDEGSIDGLISWFRLTGGELTIDDGSESFTESISNEHFIYGLNTSDNVIQSYANNNIVATYSFVGGTNPTDSFGNQGSLLSESVLTLNFAGAMQESGVNFANLSLSLAFGEVTYNAIAYGGYIGSGKFSFNNSTVSGCSECQFNGIGILSGAQAERAGIAYSFTNTDRNGDIAGVAGFNKTSQTTTTITTAR